MALVKCPECGNMVSGHAESCPKCGYPLAEGASAQANVTPPPIIRSISPLGVGVTAEANVGKVQTVEQKANRRKHRLWFALLAIVAMIAAVSVPELCMWFGLILCVLCIMPFMPHVKDYCRRLLRFNEGGKRERVLRVILCSLIGFVLWMPLLMTLIPHVQDFSRRLLRFNQDEKKERVLYVTLCGLIGFILMSAASGGMMHRKEQANAKVGTLITAAINALKAGDINAAREKAQVSLTVPYADDLIHAKKIDQQIGIATDPSRLRVALMEIPDDSFEMLQKGGGMPKELVSGYEVLDIPTAALLAKVELVDILVAREQRRQKQLAAARATGKPNAIKAARNCLESHLNKEGGYMAVYSMESATWNEDGSWSVYLEGLFVASSKANNQNFDVSVNYHVSLDGRVLDPDSRIGMRIKKW